MKKNNLFFSLLNICLLVFCVSCSNNDIEQDVTQESLSINTHICNTRTNMNNISLKFIIQKFNASKNETNVHNIMLDNLYGALEKNPISVNKKNIGQQYVA